MHRKIELFSGYVVIHMTNALTMPWSIIRVIPIHPFFFLLLFAHYLNCIFYGYFLLFFLLCPVFQFISAVCIAGANCWCVSFFVYNIFFSKCIEANLGFILFASIGHMTFEYHTPNLDLGHNRMPTSLSAHRMPRKNSWYKNWILDSP